MTSEVRRRPIIPRTVQVQVFRRDAWLCRWCLRPVIFPYALKYLDRLVHTSENSLVVAYYHPNWRRDLAPLLDELAASVDHIEPFARGGSSAVDNLATICAKCNARKNDRSVAEHLQRYPRKKVRASTANPRSGMGCRLCSWRCSMATRQR